eukprot:TRINITY_DN98_c1_g2_i2.p1 TRINITY_DN98_c1_g2~~TRINITY_DN98_c1_g2_i2.p1  ORF type:complete len:231 (-),score=75.40 TRINITY_DN98_c1_g2_i2:47-739(-)
MAEVDPLVREVESFGRTLCVRQDFSGELGATVWDAALVLCKYFENVREFPVGYFRGKRVLELGAGTGLVGLVVSLLGAKSVMITDQPQMLELIRDNVQRNHGHNVTVRTLDWSATSAALAEERLQQAQPQAAPLHTTAGELSDFVVPFDVVLASDVICFCYGYEDLVRTLKYVSDSNTRIIMSYEKRDIRDRQFFQLLKDYGFTFSKAPNEDLDPVWQSPDIGVFNIRRK